MQMAAQRAQTSTNGNPRFSLLVFPGSGITDNLADKARKLSIPLFDFRHTTH
jgi:hypothetical protein